MGCFRTLQEILDWGEADFTKRREILLQVEVRKRSEKKFQVSSFSFKIESRKSFTTEDTEVTEVFCMIYPFLLMPHL